MKLVKPDQFNRPMPLVITIPIARDLVATSLTIVIMKDQTVQVSGPLENEQAVKAILNAGLQRLSQHYAEQRSSILGPYGQALPVSPEGQA